MGMNLSRKHSKLFQGALSICFHNEVHSGGHYISHFSDQQVTSINPKELTISETTESTSVASFLDLLFIRDNSNNITTKLYDKHDTFGFNIVKFPFMSSNIPSAAAYGVYAYCCSNYSDFLSPDRTLVTRLMS